MSTTKDRPWLIVLIVVTMAAVLLFLAVALIRGRRFDVGFIERDGVTLTWPASAPPFWIWTTSEGDWRSPAGQAWCRAPVTPVALPRGDFSAEAQLVVIVHELGHVLLLADDHMGDPDHVMTPPATPRSVAWSAGDAARLRAAYGRQVLAPASALRDDGPCSKVFAAAGPSSP